jgi:hypothetical protein
MPSLVAFENQLDIIFETYCLKSLHLVQDFDDCLCLCVAL